MDRPKSDVLKGRLFKSPSTGRMIFVLSTNSFTRGLWTVDTRFDRLTDLSSWKPARSLTQSFTPWTPIGVYGVLRAENGLSSRQIIQNNVHLIAHQISNPVQLSKFHAVGVN